MEANVLSLLTILNLKVCKSGIWGIQIISDIRCFHLCPHFFDLFRNDLLKADLKTILIKYILKLFFGVNWGFKTCFCRAYYRCQCFSLVRLYPIFITTIVYSPLTVNLSIYRHFPNKWHFGGRGFDSQPDKI